MTLSFVFLIVAFPYEEAEIRRFLWPVKRRRGGARNGKFPFRAGHGPARYGVVSTERRMGAVCVKFILQSSLLHTFCVVTEGCYEIFDADTWSWMVSAETACGNVVFYYGDFLYGCCISGFILCLDFCTFIRLRVLSSRLQKQSTFNVVPGMLVAHITFRQSSCEDCAKRRHDVSQSAEARSAILLPGWRLFSMFDI